MSDILQSQATDRLVVLPNDPSRYGPYAGTQGLAYSNDRGRSWTKFSGNPVLPHLRADNRDPKVIWHAPGKKWVMALYLDGEEYALFASPNLKRWEKMSGVRIPGASECPDFFETALDGNKADTRWVFYGGNGSYLVGRFDGRNFTPDSGPHELHGGNCFYASQTFNDMPAADGRRILIPWGQVNLPGMPFNQMMGIPVELALNSTATGPRLSANPIRELALLRTNSHHIAAQPLDAASNPLAGIRAELLDLEAEFTPGSAEAITLELRGVQVNYDVARQEISCHGKTNSLPMIDGRIHLRLLVDRPAIDIFGNHGRLYMPMGIIVPADNRGLAIRAKGSGVKLNSLQVHELKSAWLPN